MMFNGIFKAVTSHPEPRTYLQETVNSRASKKSTNPPLQYIKNREALHTTRRVPPMASAFSCVVPVSMNASHHGLM